jgi:ABC-2 type transport system ATP-binding protein
MRQRVGIAQALINDPKLLFLDEPTSGLDPIARAELRDVIHNVGKQGKTVFLSSHQLSDVELLCDRVSIMVAGRIGAIGTPAELKHQFDAATMDDVFVALARPGVGSPPSSAPP